MILTIFAECVEHCHSGQLGIVMIVILIIFAGSAGHTHRGQSCIVRGVIHEQHVIIVEKSRLTELIVVVNVTKTLTFLKEKINITPFHQIVGPPVSFFSSCQSESHLKTSLSLTQIPNSIGLLVYLSSLV
jgi:hypothetical protein